MRKIAWTLLAAAALHAAAAEGAATKAQKDIVKEAMPLYSNEIVLDTAVADLAWDRATEWVMSVPDRRVKNATYNLIETYRSFDDSNTDLWCNARRIRMADETAFTANCRINNMFSMGEAKRSTAMLRRYIMTGESACMASGERWLDAAACLAECTPDHKKCELRTAEPFFPEGAGTVPSSEAPIVVEKCTVDQITAMVEAGLTREQIRAACGG